MGAFFKDALQDRLGTWGIGYMPYGGIDHGELVAIGEAVGDGDDGVYHDTWVAAADRLKTQARDALANGHSASARDLLLRSSGFYVSACRPLFGPRRDPRLLAAQRSAVAAFDEAMALSDPPGTPLAIPFEGLSLPGYFIPAEGRAAEVRPLLILTNGYDGTITDMYFASAVAASRRGYHVLMFDGPGQGSMLAWHGVPMRPDCEVVINAVVDVAVTLPNVDTDRMVLNGWSLGGYLAPRGASGEPRLAACVADPGQFSMAGGFAAYAVKLGASPDEARDLSTLDQSIIDRLRRMIDGDRIQRWTFTQRGFWVHGVTDLRGYLAAAQQFTMEGRAGMIRCPTLLTMAENDPLTASTQTLFDQMTCPKTIIRFSAADGAGDHCEMGNRSLLNRRTFDWLEETLRP
ncbi:MAG: alpha/beta hydrolase [Rhodovulum sulfidophilum]|uniref:Alpha/beta hydrolase n=1 Tax=Rhodovulum sulfidophilum TaxID=35806 RepID=A0A2W5NHF2_RHOSU|nr:MAG: alpha/beta hydrolase [Rhodovulum sulfidophilum]